MFGSRKTDVVGELERQIRDLNRKLDSVIAMNHVLLQMVELSSYGADTPYNSMIRILSARAQGHGSGTITDEGSSRGLITSTEDMVTSFLRDLPNKTNPQAKAKPGA